MLRSFYSRVLCASISFLMVATPAFSELSSERIDELYDYAGIKLLATHSTLSRNAMPEKSYGTTWTLRTADSWISGFFAGTLWQMYSVTGDSDWMDAAIYRTQALNGQEYNDSNHDVGFRVFNSFGQGYKWLPDGALRDDFKSRILIAADTLASRYNTAYSAIESWDGDRVIIDNMMNLELLMWAADNGSVNAANLRRIAINHAQTTIDQHIRSDGSTYHVVEFNSDGSVLDKYTHQGYADESTWSRGQAWGLYGFTVMYRFTGNTLYLDTAMALADYFVDNLPAAGVPPYDFDDPNQTLLDSSAGAIAASGMLELCTYVSGTLSDRYFGAAEQILEGLDSPAILTDGSTYPSILREGSVRMGDHQLGLIYGDYYFVEALSRYADLASVIPGDANGDGTVNLDDFIILKQNYGRSVGMSFSTGDFNGDGTVNLDDFIILKQNYGAGS